MNGREYAFKILKDNGFAVEKLLEAANGMENAWLELKADPFCLRDDPPPEKGEVTWHTLKAIVAMANTRGGCIAFGIDDKTKEYCPLSLKSKKGYLRNSSDFDEFVRQVRESICEKTSFTKNGKRYELTCGLDNLCEMYLANYQGHKIIVLMVSPMPDNNFCYVRVGNNEEGLWVRATGDEGRCKELVGHEIREYTPPLMSFDELRGIKKFDNMPLSVSCFVGRKDKLAELHKILVGACAKIPLLCGSDGVGKSQLVYEYCRTHYEEYDSLIRIDASRQKSFIGVIASLALNPDFRRKFLFGTSGSDVGNRGNVRRSEEELFERVKCAITENRLGRVLLFVDDVECADVVRSDVIRQYIGMGFRQYADIVMAARGTRLSYNDSDLVVTMEIQNLPVDDCVCLFNSKRKLVNDANRDLSERIAVKLGGNPWCIDLVAEYLKQKRFRKDSDYADCLQRIEEIGVDGFLNDCRKEPIGNVTGVVQLEELFSRVCGELLDEEKIICRLAAMGFEYEVDETSLRGAFEVAYGRRLEDDEWSWYVGSLEKKGILFLKKDENEVLRFKDILLGVFFRKGAENDDKLTSGLLAYIKSRFALGTYSCKESCYLKRLLMNLPCSQEDKIDVVFDVNRYGWPLGLLGLDTVTKVCRPGSTSRDLMNLRQDLKELCDLAKGNAKYAADVMEIDALISKYDDESECLDVVKNALKLREEIYAEDKYMLGRAYQHMAEFGLGGTIELSEELEYINKAIACYIECESRHSDIASVYDLKAYVLDSDGANANQVREALVEAYRIWPPIYSSREGFDEREMEECIEEGRYPSFQ